MRKYDINIKEIKKQTFDKLESSQLVLEFRGKDVNYSLLNTLRRLSLEYVPSYSFCNQSIIIEKNTSIFNNDYMRLRLSQFAWPKVDVNVYYLENEYWEHTDYSDLDRKKHPEDKKILEVYCNVKNNTSEIMNVTTNELQYYNDGERVNVMDKEYPHLIIKLKPDQEFAFKATAVLGVGLRNAIWGAARNCWYNELHEDDDYPHDFNFFIESSGQQDEYEILKKCCKILKKKIDIIKKKTMEEFGNQLKTNKLLLSLIDEDHTIGNIINLFLQDNDKVLFSGLSRPDLLVRAIEIKFETVDDNLLQVLYQVFDDINNMFDQIHEKLSKLASK